MSEQIRMNFGMMEEAAQAFSQGKEELESVLAEVKNIANILDSDGLLGAAGDALSNACTGPLSQSIQSLAGKLDEVSNDLTNAINEMRQAEKSTQGYY